MENESRITVLFRCQNKQCTIYGQPFEQPVTRTALREMSQPESTDKFMCIRCGEMFPLTKQEKVGNLEMLDKEARAS